MNDLKITLNQDEAIVLFEWLHRIDGMEPKPFGHAAEQTVVWRIIGQLESKLIEPFAENYQDIVSHARKSIGG